MEEEEVGFDVGDDKGNEDMITLVTVDTVVTAGDVVVVKDECGTVHAMRR